MPEATVDRRATRWPIEGQLLFWTARVRMSPEVENRIRSAARENINWIYLIRQAIQHETTGLLYWNLRHICPDSVPSGVLGALAERYRSQGSEAQYRAGELVRILAYPHGKFVLTDRWRNL